MSTLLSPFVTKEISCPACRKPSTQRFFRKRAYVPEDKESDQHYRTYRYTDERYRQVHPPYYFLYYCPHCKFTDTTEEYTKPATTDSAQQVIRLYRRLTKEQAVVIETLAQRINYGEIDFSSAVNIHALATYIQLLPDEENLDTYKIARFFLRIAWLFREAEPSETGEPVSETQAVSPAKAKLLARVKANQVDGPRNGNGDDLGVRMVQTLGALEGHLMEAGSAIEELSQLAERRALEIAQEVNHPEAYPYETCVNQLALLVEKSRELLGALRSVCDKDRAEAAARQSADMQHAAVSVSQFQDFLKQVKVMWPELPTNELEALQGAIRYFRIAMERDPRFSNHEAYLKLVLLVCDLYVRCDDYPGAILLIRGIYQSAVDERKQCTEQLQAEGLSSSQRNRLKTRLERVNASLEQTGEYRRMLLDELRDREIPRVHAVIQRFAQNPEHIEEALLKLGIPPDLIHRLKERGGPLEFLRAPSRR